MKNKTKSKKPKTRNPIAKNVRVNKPKIIPDKKKKKRVNGCRKGKVGELELANFLKDRGIEARRGQQYEGSSDSPDVIAGGCMSGVHLECKCVQAGNLYHWLDQACTDAGFDKIPVVAHRKNKKRWVAILDLRDFVTIMERIYDREQQHA